MRGAFYFSKLYYSTGGKTCALANKQESKTATKQTFVKRHNFQCPSALVEEKKHWAQTRKPSLRVVHIVISDKQCLKLPTPLLSSRSSKQTIFLPLYLSYTLGNIKTSTRFICNTYKINGS